MIRGLYYLKLKQHAMPKRPSQYLTVLWFAAFLKSKKLDCWVNVEWYFSALLMRMAQSDYDMENEIVVELRLLGAAAVYLRVEVEVAGVERTEKNMSKSSKHLGVVAEAISGKADMELEPEIETRIVLAVTNLDFGVIHKDALLSTHGNKVGAEVAGLCVFSSPFQR